MSRLRDKRREARLLLTIDALSKEGEAPEAVDVFAVDFLLQHPSLLNSYSRNSNLRLTPNIWPSATETESSEEALLRWKRSVGGKTLAPMIGRLIARRLVQRKPGGRVELAPKGRNAVKQLGELIGVVERDRVPQLAAQVAANPRVARQSLLAALAEDPE